MPHKIKNKFTSPKPTEFTPKDLVVDVKNGHLYYKSNFAVFKVNATLHQSTTATGEVIGQGEQIGVADVNEFVFNNDGLFDGISNFTVSNILADGTGTVNIGSLVIPDIPSGRIVLSGENGVLQSDSTIRHIGGKVVTNHLTSNSQEPLKFTPNENDFDTSDVKMKLNTSATLTAPALEIIGGIKIEGSTSNPGNLRALDDVIAFASDKRLKENIINISNPLNKIKQLRGVYFDWKKETKELGFNPPRKKEEIGMIAQEVEEVIPQAIEPAPFNEKYKTIKYDRIIPLLVECINEQQKQINNLKNQINNGR